MLFFCCLVRIPLSTPNPIFQKGLKMGRDWVSRYYKLDAERQGFEPWEPVKVQHLSRVLLSTTQPSLQITINF